jgi:hypothetical protein
VVGTHGYGFVRSTLMGSVARRLLHLTPCAVLAVPGTGLSESVAESVEQCEATGLSARHGR